MEFKVRASPGDVDEQLQRKARTADSVIRRGLEELGERGEATMRGFAPSLGGSYAAQIGHVVEGTGTSATVSIGSKSRKAHLVERGRSPGRMPPPPKISSLLGLDRRAGFMVARAIGRAGTDGHHVVERTRDALADDVRRIGAKVSKEIGDLHR